MADTWQYNPLSVSAFALGQGPFRVRGLAYTTTLAYIEKKLPGGRPAVWAKLAGDPFAPFFEQIFLLGSDYDISPYVRLAEIVSRIEGIPIGRFIEERARWSARATTQRLWRHLLHARAPEPMAERLHLAFNRYFQPCVSKTTLVPPARLEGELSKLPRPMNGLFVRATAGFVSGAMEIVGARSVKVDFDAPRPDGQLSGIPLERVRFVATWK
ncbi:hypothetical protein LVJ94_01645 [Pendulispora rubella]|uniref:Uncharacterized protein n=1 Tax=Pendulispora rubella TaxID=2741070 RepID=A0ABZ2LB58_9BACT